MYGMGIENELTRFLDKFVKDSSRISGFNVYIFEKNGHPDIFDVDDDTYGMYIRYPGYTCANVIMDRNDDTVVDFKLTRRGGGFKGKDETIFVNDNKLESLVLERFGGKKLQ